MDLSKRFTKDVIEKMRDAILHASGNEVFFTGEIDSKGVLVSVTAGARGNADSVPVNFSQMRENSVLVHNHPSGNLNPSNADLNVASIASENAQGFYIVNNEVTEVYVVMEPVKPKVIKKLDSQNASFYLAEGGPLSKQSEFFEERSVQLELLENIVTTFNENSVGIFEAGTGVGKSYAYLIPSMLWALENKERVVISTGTINLQQQLSEKDIPSAEKIIGKKIKSVLVKGRQNFVCLRRLEDLKNERDLFNDETEVIDKIVEWAISSPTGSKSELTFVPPESIWTRLCSESDACMNMRCPFHEKCFVMSMRKEASSANLLIVNHHILFADIEARLAGVGFKDSAVLPPYNRIVFDEAHDIEAAATSFFSGSLTRFRLLRLLNLLYRKKRAATAGYIFTLQILSSSQDMTLQAINAIDSVKSNMQNLEIAANDLIATRYTIRLCRETSRAFGSVISLMTQLGESIASVCSCVREIIDGIDNDEKDVPQYWETKNILHRLDDLVVFCKNFAVWDEMNDTVFWMQKVKLSPSLAKNATSQFSSIPNRRNSAHGASHDFAMLGMPKSTTRNDKNVTHSNFSSDDASYFVQFVQTPLDIAQKMSSGVFEPMKSVVCTSATLSINRQFNFWMRRVGASFVEKERLLMGQFDSPFPYKKNMLFAVPSDSPIPTDVNYQAFVEQAVVRLIRASFGKTLVLFTSYDSLKHSCDYARAMLKNTGINIFKQGDDDRFRLLDKFKKDKDSVLFATDSFREGIDVPGDSLSQVIIVKLPFSVPDDPVFAARSELINNHGGSSFWDLSIPDSIIKFRQGIGRLIRRSDDRGVVVVLDRRIIEKNYGQLFINSMPETKRLFTPLEEISKNIENFLTS